MPEPRSSESIAATRSLSATEGMWPGDRWWSSYNDPQFTALIEEGLRASPDVAAATARFRRAAGLAQQAAGALLPAMDFEARTGLEKQSYNNGFPKEFLPKGWQDRGSITLGLGFDPDLWGRSRAAVAAATSEARAAELDARQARLMVTTGIAEAYAELARLHVLRDTQQRTLDLRLATRKLITGRELSGLETRGNVRQAEATVSTARANLAAADEAIALRRNQLAALIGAGPDRALAIVRPALAALQSRGLPVDVTTNLLARRPDIAAALIRTKAAASRVKVARAAFFPAIRVDALIGLQSLGLDQLVDRDSVYGSVGPAISLPIFHGGAISGQYRGARAAYDEAVADYDKAVLEAYREVADAVTSRRILADRLAYARAALVSSEEAYAVARKRYEGGLSTYLDVLNVEDRLLAARQLVAELDARAFALDVALIRALGGGFTSADARDFEDRSNG